MAGGAFDKWAAEQGEPEAAAPPAARPRYAPAPTTPKNADARLAEVNAATAELDAWVDSKRKKKGLDAVDRSGRAGAGGKPSTDSVPGVVSTPESIDEATGGPRTAQPVQPRAAPSKGNEPGDFDKWAATIEPPPQPEPKKPGAMARLGAFLSEGRSKPDPSLAGITAEQARGLAGGEEPLPPAEPKKQDAAPPRARRGGLRSEVQPFVAGYAEREIPPPVPKTAGQMLETPFTPVLSEEQQLALEREQGSKSPALQAREQAEAQRAWRDRRPYAEAKPLELTNEISEAIRASTKNPAARGVVSGASELGKVGTGAVRLLSDVIGADALADFARKAENKADAISRGSTQDLTGNDKLAADIFASVVGSTPPLVLGVAGVGQRAALNTLMVQTTLQEYGAGRDAGFGIGESLSRAMIMGYAERLGEQFDFMPQVKALKALAKKTSTEELAKLAGEVLVKNIPGEELTTTIQFIADKVGPAALRPDATMGDYLEAVAETFKVAVGQSLLMAGGPAAVNAGRNALARADQVSGMSSAEIVGRLRQRDLEEFVAPQGDMPPTEARGAALKRFDELAAQFGFNPKAVARAKEAANQMPAGDVPGFLAKLADTLQDSGLSQKPIDEASLRALRQTVAAAETEDTPAAEPAAEAGAAPAAQDYTGLDETLDAAAHQAATSPLNDRPEPTDAQKEAGNYAKGHVRISGMDVSIENPKGSIRRSKADAGDRWEVTMPGHYGYIRGSTGADGDHVDLFIGDRGDNGSFWVINQTAPDGKSFDEHKVITGVDSAAEAIDLYRRSFADGFGTKVLGSVSQRMDAGQLKALLPDMSRANAVHTPKVFDDNKPDVAVPAAQSDGTADGSGVQPGGSSGTVGPVPAAPEPVDRSAASPATGPGPAQAVADGGGTDAALTDIPALKRAWSAAAAAGNTEEARRLNDLIVAAKAAQASGSSTAAPVAESQAPAPSEPGDGGVATTPAGSAPEPRVIGKYGRTPKAATPIELRPNADGTLTPFDGKYEMLDYESGDPIVLPANVTDAQAAAAIRAAGSIGDKDKFYGVKPDPESNVAPAPASAADGAPTDGSAEPAPGAATNEPSREQQRAAAQQRVDGLRALLKCLQS